MTKKKIKKIIRKNQDKSLNELKRMIKAVMPQNKRKDFTFDELRELIIEVNQEREEEIKKYNKHQVTRNTRRMGGIER